MAERTGPAVPTSSRSSADGIKNKRAARRLKDLADIEALGADDPASD